MVNVKHSKVGTKLVIEIDLSQSAGPSASGKSNIIASTQGNVDLGDGVKLGLNVYRPAR